MEFPHYSTKPQLSRRSFLKGTGAVLALPWLDAMVPAFATRAQAMEATAVPKRFLAMQYGLGFHAPFLFPDQPGPLTSTPYLDRIKEHWDSVTLVGGLSHIEQNGMNGHSSGVTWLTAASFPQLPGFKNSISIDQQITQLLRPDTRFPFLPLASGGLGSISWTANGVMIPGVGEAPALFEMLFVDGTAEERKHQIDEIARGKSILDTVRDEAKDLHRSLGARDQEKFDQYLASVRDLEQRLQQNEAWADRPKPKVDYSKPQEPADRNDILAKTKLMHDLMALALQTDSTRIITYNAGGGNNVPTIPGVETGWHDLSHHGQDEMKIDELAIIERAEFDELNRFFTLLKQASDSNGPVLDNTYLLIGSNLGNASAHTWRDLPILIAGGDFKHGQYIQAGGAGNDNARFCNLFVQLAQRVGAPIEKFGTSDGTSVKGLG